MADNTQDDDNFVVTPAGEEDDFVVMPVEEEDDFSLTAVAPPDGVLPPPAEGMFNEIKTPSIVQKFRASPLAPDFVAEDYPEGTYNRFEALDRANAIYEAYRNSPNVEQSFLGDLIWTNPEDPADRRVVPKPSLASGLGEIFGGDAGPNFGSNVYQSGRNLLRNVSKFAESGGQMLGIGDDVIDSESFPRLVTDDRSGFFDSLVVDEGAAMAGGAGAGALVVRGLANLPRIIKGLSFALTEGGIFAAGIDDESRTGLIGDQAMLPLYEGLKIDPNSPEAEQILRRKFNILMDTAATTLGADAALKVGAVSLQTAFNLAGIPILKRVLSSEAQEEALGQDLLKMIADLDPTDANYNESIERLSTLLEKNKNVIVDFDVDNLANVAFVTDTATALMRAADNQDIEGLEQAVTSLQNLSRANANRAGSRGRQQAAAAVPEQSIVDTLDNAQSEQVFGRLANETGEDAANFRGAVQGAADRDLATSDAATNLATQQAKQAEIEQQIAQLVQEDIPFISQIEDLYKAVGFDSATVANRTQDELVDSLYEASSVLTKRKNDKFSAVRELEGDIDGEAIYNVLNEISSSETLFDNVSLAVATKSDATTAFRTMLSRSRPQMVLKEVVEEGKTVKKEVPEEADEARERFIKELETEGVDFGLLYGNISPALSDAITDLRSRRTTVDTASAGALEKFQEYIKTDALEFAAENSDRGDDILKAVQEADDFFKQEFAPYFRAGGPLEELDRIRRQTEALTGSRGRFQARQVGIDQTNNLVQQDGNRVYVEQLMELAGRTIGDEDLALNPDTVTNFIIGDVVRRLTRQGDRVAEAAGEVSQQQVVQNVKNELQQYAGLLETAYPNQYQQIVDFSNRLDAAVGTGQQNAKLLDEAQKSYAEAQKEIFNTRYKALFGGSDEVVANPYGELETLINSKQGLPQLQTLLASGDETIIRGVKSAYTQNLRNKIVTAAKNQSGGSTLSQSFTTKALDDATTILNRGREIFTDQPGFMEGLTSLMEVAGLVQRTRTARPTTLAGSNTMQSANLDQQFEQLVNRQVKVIFGPLTRIGTRIGVISKAIGNRVDQNFVSSTIDAALADPDEFVRLIRMAGQAGRDGRRSFHIGTVRGQQVRIPLPNANERRLLFRYVVRANVYDGTEEEFNAAYDAALQENLQDATYLEMQLQERDTEAQMQELGLQ